MRDDADILTHDISENYSYDFSIFDGDISEEIKGISQRAASILNIKDYARFDFRIRDGKPYLFDIAGTPYTIEKSSVAYLFEQCGLKYKDIYKTIVTCMLSNYEYEEPNQKCTEDPIT
jgi:D-alanine-D-alanine ligase-like ATP-grasp enzyme